MVSHIKGFIPDCVLLHVRSQATRRPVPLAPFALSKGERTKRRILDGAFSLFIGVHAEAFTLRNLAGALGMRIGNLTYHYQSKSELLEAMVLDRLATYADEILTLLESEEPSPMAALEGLIAYLVRDLREPGIAFFPQLWALALTDPRAAELMEEIHEQERQVIASLIQACKPDWQPMACDALALHLVAAIEGLTIFVGRNHKSQGIYAAPEQELLRVLRTALD
jgi:AcrR family transcriptional regulator